MGKGYNNFMSKKAFHPGSYANQKRIHEAEEKADAKRKHDEETLAQYLKEQELFNQKSLVSKESKEKLSLNFMYEAPPGLKKPDEKQTDKVQWKGPGTSTSGSSKIESKTKQNDLKEESNICLEWKREKPARKRPADCIEPKRETKLDLTTISKIKVEPQIDLKWKRKVKSESNSSCISSNRNTTSKHHHLSETKRIKKEI